MIPLDAHATLGLFHALEDVTHVLGVAHLLFSDRMHRIVLAYLCGVVDDIRAQGLEMHALLVKVGIQDLNKEVLHRKKVFVTSCSHLDLDLNLELLGWDHINLGSGWS